MKKPFTFIIAIILLCLTGCDKSSNASHVPQATIEITDIIDKASQQPISTNIVTFRRETPEGKIIETKEFKNQKSLSTIIPADGSVRLFVIVEAPGYVTWSNAIRMNLKADKPLYIRVEMERQTEIQGF